MTRSNQTQEQSQLITSHAIDTVDAYAMAHEVVSDLFAIFEAIEKLALEGLGNERLLRTLSHAGFRYASDKLKLFDEKIVDASKTLDELKELKRLRKTN